MAKIIHYRDKCIGCGICHDMQPELWRMSRNDGKATLIHATEKKQVYMLTLPPGFEESTMHVVVACPVRVIKLT